MSTTIRDEHHLRVVPDGTIISWLRIPGDRTSEAVAFVRREVEPPLQVGDRPTVTVWISPGGWNPHTIEEAGVRFPCQVVRWGDVSVEPLVGDEVPALVETLDSGGAYTRIAALDAAVQLFKADAAIHWVLPRNGEGPFLEPLLTVAKEFEDHLLRDDLADALNTIVDAGVVNPDVAYRAYAAWERGDTDPSPTDIVTGQDQ